MVYEQIRLKATITKEKEIKQKTPKKEEYELKRRLTEYNKYWNDWKFLIHWNKLDWLNPRSWDERKNQFCVSSKKMLR